MEKKKKIKLTDAIKALNKEMDQRESSKHKRNTNIEKKKEKTVEDARKNMFRKSMHQFKFLEIDDEEEKP